MRRGPGIAGLKSRQAATEQFRRTGDEVKQVSLAAMKDQMATFKKNLEDFARKYRQDIRRDPAFRAQFQAMCANIGVDPLASSKGVWAELLGFGDFYYELGVQIAEACLATRAHNGGLMELPALLRYVQRRRGSGSETISEDDVSRAIAKLKVLGGGFDMVTIGPVAYVRSVPVELNLDANKLLELAQERGFLSAEDAIKRTGWTATRVDTCLQALLKDGLAMVDDGAPGGGRLYWFPCIGSSQEG